MQTLKAICWAEFVPPNQCFGVKEQKGDCGGLSPDKSQTPTQPLVSSSPTGWGENRRKARHLVNWNNDSLIEKAKAEGIREAKRSIHWLLPTARQMSNHFLGSKISACIIIFKKHKCYHWKHPPFLLFPFSLYCGAEHHTVWNIPVIIWGHLSWLCPLPTSCPPLASSLQGKEKALRLCKHCSVTTKTLVRYQWQSTAPYGLLGTKLTPSQPDSVCL